jgi:hypothetical protein
LHQKTGDMVKKTKSELSKMGKAITSEAKRIRKASPKMKWQTAMKQAGKKLKGKF